MLLEHCKISSKEHLHLQQVDPGFSATLPQPLWSVWLKIWGLQSLLMQWLLYKTQTVSFALSEDRTSGICWAVLSERALSAGLVTSAIHQFC